MRAFKFILLVVVHLVFLAHPAWAVYDPTTGQFLSREPLGENESLNLYSYCHNDPVNKVDVLGLKETSVINANDPFVLVDGVWHRNEVILHQADWFFMESRGILPGSGHTGRAAGPLDFAGWILENGKWTPTAGNSFMVEVSRIAEERYHLSTHANIGKTAMGIYGVALAAPALMFAAPEAGAGVYVYGGHALRTAWSYGGVRAAGYGLGGMMAAGSGYGLLTDPGFRSDWVAMEQASPLPGEGMAMGASGLRMMAADARTAFRGFDFLAFSRATNRRLSFPLMPEPLYIVPPTMRSSTSRAWPVTWDGARSRYWTEIGRTEYAQSSGWYSQGNILEMLAGRSPKIKAEVRLPGGMTEVRDIPIELHHYLLAQRSGSKAAHQPWNLVPSLPWSHANMDEFRNIDFELIRIISGPNSWTP